MLGQERCSGGRFLVSRTEDCVILYAVVVLIEEVEKPTFNTELSNAETLLGNDANFACKVSGKPGPQVAWSVLFTTLRTSELCATVKVELFRLLPCHVLLECIRLPVQPLNVSWLHYVSN